MKYLLSFFLLFSFLQNMDAQNWSLFPLNQKTYWKNGSTFHLYYNDKTVTDSTKNTHYFGAEYLTKDSSFLCYKNILEEWYQIEKPPVDSIFSNSDFWFEKMENQILPFYHLAEEGKKWTVESNWSDLIDSIVFICTKKDTKEVFGNIDSIKVFTLQSYKNNTSQNYFDDIQYMLSKNFGLIEYTPLSQLIPNWAFDFYKIIGLNDGQAHGFTNSWEDYFGHFKVGQKLKWKDVNQFIPVDGCYRTEDYYVDSILQVVFSDDSVRLIVDRSGIQHCWKFGNTSNQWDSTNSIKKLDTIVHYRSTHENKFRTPTGWFHFEQYAFGYGTDIFDQYSIDENGLYHGIWINNFGFSEPDDWCGFIASDPSNIPTQLKSCLGIVRDGWHGGLFGEEKNIELIGYTKDGIAYGDVLNPVFEKPAPNLFFNIYPNPTPDYLHIDFLNKNNSCELILNITNTTGLTVFSKKIKNGFEKINIVDMPAGIYFISIYGENTFGRERFVKN